MSLLGIHALPVVNAVTRSSKLTMQSRAVRLWMIKMGFDPAANSIRIRSIKIRFDPNSVLEMVWTLIIMLTPKHQSTSITLVHIIGRLPIYSYNYHSIVECMQSIRSQISNSDRSRVGRRSRRTFSTNFEIFRRCFHGVVIYFFNSNFQICWICVGIFSHFFICCLIFSSKFMLIFLQSVFYRD